MARKAVHPCHGHGSALQILMLSLMAERLKPSEQPRCVTQTGGC